MCFSAGASFMAGAVISAVGVATIAKANKSGQKLFAVIPLVFGIQQLAEGCIWVTLQNSGHLAIQNISMYVFLLASDVLWPVMIPGSVLLMEENPKRKKAIRIFLFAGALLSIYYGFCLTHFRVTPEILNCHISYGGDSIHSMMIPAFLFYIVVTITPLFISSVKGMKLMGILMFLAVVVTVIFYVENVTSVWCFFAAILSIIIYWMVSRSGNHV